MIDLKLLHNDFDTVAAKLAKKKVDPDLLASLHHQSHTYKTARQDLEALQTLQNEKSRQFGDAMRQKIDAADLKAELDANKAAIAQMTETVRTLEEALEEIALRVPNFPDESVPEGDDENDNVEIKKVLTPRTFDFPVKDHVELGEKYGYKITSSEIPKIPMALSQGLDFERGVKLAKSRFCVMVDQTAKLERALINYMLDFNTQRGFQEISVPYLVNSTMMTGTGQLPKFKDDLFKVEDEDLYLIPTAEVPLTNLLYDEIIDSKMLPIKLTAHTPCFRKEAGSAGRDTRGMIRQHQFHKVELVAITHPDESEAMLQTMVACASDLLTSLGLPHRLITLCGGDMGFSAAKTIDIEVWMPSQEKYREISSVSNTRDFQARRAKIRFKDGKANRLVHTLNGSSLAVGRTLVAIMENFQQPNGTIAIPNVLRKYL